MAIKLVGILNVTPDSFSDGGLYDDPQRAADRVKELINCGADLIDIGGQASGPGTQPVEEAVEIKRVTPVVKEFNSLIPFSVDTYRAEIARAVLSHGAFMINDISAGSDPKMFAVVSNSDAKIVLMFSSQQTPHDYSFLSNRALYKDKDLISVILAFFEQKVELAVRAGVRREQIVLDPGMGAFISAESADSWGIIRRFNELRSLGFPLMFASSRKGFLKRDNESSPKDRDPLSALTGVLCAQSFNFSGPEYIRTHNPKLQREFLNVSH